VVAAKKAAKPKETPMRKPNSKRRSPSRSSGRKTAKLNNTAAQTTTHKLVKPKRGTQPQPHPSSAKQTERTETKQARILAMLRASSGVTIDAMMHATGVFAGRYVALLFAVTTAVEPTVAQTGNVETTRIWMSPHSDLVFDTRSRGRFRPSLQ
jgi:Protein of unknown function (DUF3489)